MRNMKIRHSTKEDYSRICEIYSIARDYMKKTGNPTQWGDSEPALDLVLKDIEIKNSYVVIDNEEIVGVFAFIIGPDKYYQVIDGNWLNDEEYGTIHRIASAQKVKGVFEAALEYCESQINNIRIDTHNDNVVMQHKIEKNGFTKCGIIYCHDGTPRIAYHKVI